MESPIVHRALVSEVPVLADTLQAAFDGYPWTNWAFPADKRATRLRAPFALYLTASVNGLGEVSTTQDHKSVALWFAPGLEASSDNRSRRLDERADDLLGENSGRVAAANAAVDAHHPAQPYWFLGAVGTRPIWRGFGFAGAVLAPMLLCCDRAGLRAVLETSTPSNVQFYSRLGFETTADVQPGDGAPLVWVMTRAPQTTVAAPRRS